MSHPCRHIIPLLLCCCSLIIQAQTTQTISYTTREGLSSNSVYRTAIDRRGFLWIATENGLARFDGRKFDTYTTTRGLTDNEIIDLFIDSSGTIWAIPFRRSPCYYNPKKDRFENETTDPELAKIDLANTHKVHLLQYGGIAFSNNLRHLFIYKDGKTTTYKDFMPPKTTAIQKVVEYKPGEYLFFNQDSTRYFSNGRLGRKEPFGKVIIAAEHLNNKVYLVGSTGVTILSLDKNGGFTMTGEKQFPFEIRIFCYTGKSFAITSLSGYTYLVDTSTLELKENILSKMQVRNVLEDNSGNAWFCTMENGLIKVQQKRISSYTEVEEMKQNFNALLKNKYIIAGTNNGEVFIYDGLYMSRRIQLTDTTNIDAWVRKIVETSKGVYVSTQTGSYFFDNDLRRPIEKFLGSSNYSSKTAVLLNDSTLGVGTHNLARKYNLNTGKFTDSVLKRVISLVADKRGKVYIGSNDGLYRWDKDTLFSFGPTHKGFTYRVNTLACSPDDIVWVGLGSDSLLAMKHDKVIASLPLGGIIPGNICKSLFCNKAGELWLGTNKGLNKIDYSLEDDKFFYTNTYFGIADGLIGEQVNDITISNDTVFVATSGGISYMPVNLLLPVSDISSFITRITINNEDQELGETYKLRYYQNDITIEFSGVDLTGFLPLFEYSINGGEWSRTEKIELKRLAPGSYAIRIRAVKRDGKPSSSEAAASFNIRKAWWKTNFFRVGIGALIFGTFIYFLQKRNEQKQKAAVDKVVTEKKIAELEMQALKAQINPHFVFNCLNSIKGFIYEKDYAQADRYLDKFSQLLRSTMDNADASIISLDEEIKYLDTYLQLEKLRFGDKFEYRIDVLEGLDTKNLYVPAMLLQPYVENAIRHGVRFLENKKGEITISAGIDKGDLICVIDDNGVGRERSQQLKGERHIEYQSRGMQLSKRRAELYAIQQEVVDKKDEKGKSTGTRIVLIISPELKP